MTITSDVPFLALLWATFYGALVARPNIKLLGHKFLEAREKWGYFFFAVLINFIAMVLALGFMGTEITLPAILVFVVIPLVTSPLLVLYYRFLLGDKFPLVMEAMGEAQKRVKEEKQAAKKASEDAEADKETQDHSKTETKDDSSA